MKWGLTVRKDGVVREYEDSGEGLDKLLKTIRSVLTEVVGEYVDVSIDVYEEG
ncbi:MAG: hypothetical protein ACTSR0_04120 [Candidatus Asgardarchaeia archaeon]